MKHYNEKYSHQGRGDIPKRVRCFEYFKEILDRCDGKTVLNIGASGDCGLDPGSIHETLRQSASMLCGVDVQPMPEMGIYYMNIEKGLRDTETLPSETHVILNTKFDVIIFFGVLDHLYNQGQAMEEINKMSKPGTTMYLAVQNLNHSFTLFRGLLGVHIRDDGDRSLRSEAMLKGLLERYRWKIESIRYCKSHGPAGLKLWRRIYDFFLPRRLGVTVMLTCKRKSYWIATKDAGGLQID